MSEHFTLGPWELRKLTHEADDFEGYAVVPARSNPPVWLAVMDSTSPEIQEANGRLMAAAPELYELCLSAVSVIRQVHRDVPAAWLNVSGIQFAYLEDRLWAAIAKAREGTVPTEEDAAI